MKAPRRGVESGKADVFRGQVDLLSASNLAAPDAPRIDPSFKAASEIASPSVIGAIEAVGKSRESDIRRRKRQPGRAQTVLAGRQGSILGGA